MECVLVVAGEGGASWARSVLQGGWRGRGRGWWVQVFWRCSHRGRASSSPDWKQWWWWWWNWSWSWACPSSSCPSVRPPPVAGHRSGCQCHEQPGGKKKRCVTVTAEVRSNTQVRGEKPQLRKNTKTMVVITGDRKKHLLKVNVFTSLCS